VPENKGGSRKKERKGKRRGQCARLRLFPAWSAAVGLKVPLSPVAGGGTKKTKGFRPAARSLQLDSGHCKQEQIKRGFPAMLAAKEPEEGSRRKGEVR